MAPTADAELCGCKPPLYGGVGEVCGPAVLGTELESFRMAKFEVARGLRFFFTGGFALGCCIIRGDSEGERRELMSIAKGVILREANEVVRQGSPRATRGSGGQGHERWKRLT